MREKKHVMHERENIDKYIKDKEYIANTYVMRCFFIASPNIYKMFYIFGDAICYKKSFIII